MKYVITGSTGHISKPIITALVKAGHQVTVISSNPDRVSEIESLGATAAVGSITDTAFLIKAFSGADAAYTMVPPIHNTTSWKSDIEQVGKNYAEAIKANKIKHVVNLSSIGAHMPVGCGPVSGLNRVELIFNDLKDTNIIHLRPAYFYYNLLNMIGLIKNAGIVGSNFEISDKKFLLVSPADIAVVAAQKLLSLDFTGKSIQYIASDEVSTNDVAAALGNSIGKPDLKWVAFTDDQSLQGALQAGLPKELAENYTEMGHAIAAGQMFEDYWKHRPASFGKIKLADFAKTFAAAYNAKDVVAAH